MIKSKTKIFILVALIVFEVVMIFISVVAKKSKCEILIAKYDIDEGTTVTSEMFEQKEVTQDLKDSMFRNSVSSYKEIEGLVTKSKLEAREAIYKNNETFILGDEQSLALREDNSVKDSYFLNDDERLVTISVDAVGSLNYSLKKGDFVDVIYSSTEESTGGLYSGIILQHMEIYDVQNVSVTEDSVVNKKQNITLIATLKEALILVAGNRNGTLNLALNPLAGCSEPIDPVSILSYAAEEPASKESKLNGMYNYVIDMDMTDNNKKKILDSIENEKGIDSLIDFINSTVIDDEQKAKLISILEGAEE